MAESPYFSKYRGRGGPALAPGIVQMMGSIGDEYAKGITSFADSIVQGVKEKKQREQLEEETKLWKDLIAGPKNVDDTEKYEEYLEDNEEQRESLEEEIRVTTQQFENEVSASEEAKDNLNSLVLNQPKKLSSDIEKFTKVIGDRENRKKKLANQINEFDSRLLEIEDEILNAPRVRRTVTGADGGAGFPSLLSTDAPDINVTRRLQKEKQSIINRKKAIEASLNNLQKSQDNELLYDHLEKLKNLKGLELEIPGSTLGYGELVRDDGGNWVQISKDQGVDYVVSERARVFSEISQSPEYEMRRREQGVSRVSPEGFLYTQTPGFKEQFLNEQTMSAYGVKPEHISAMLVLPETTIGAKAEAARQKMAVANTKLEEFLARPVKTQFDFTKKQTPQELAREVLDKVDTKQLRPSVLPAVAAYLEKTKGPEYQTVKIDGNTILLSDPTKTAITQMNKGDLSTALGIKRFAEDVAKTKHTNIEDLDRDFSSTLEELDSQIYIFNSAKSGGYSPSDKDKIEAWSEQDEERLKQLLTKKKDLERQYKIKRSKLDGKPPVSSEVIEM
tara:strand:- start:155 stop:1837 length:1683 start_codon:yes stop_codon:yes gene_type:complete